MWLKVLSVFGLGMVGLWEGIPAGFALRLHPLLIGLISAAGTSVATLIVLFLGDRIRTRLLSKPLSENKGVPRDRLIDRVWRRYGVIGLGLLAPGLIGAPIGVALGLSLGVMARQLLFWIFAGIMLWTVGLTLAGMLGTAGVMHLLHR